MRNIVFCLLLVGCGGGSGEADGGDVTTDSRGVDARVETDGGDLDADGPDAQSPDAARPDGDAPGVAVTWEASDEDFPSPERGFYQFTDLLDDRDFSDFDETLIYTGIRLDDYRNAALPPGLLVDLEEGLAAARQAGKKVVLRFQYNGGPIGAEDASLSRLQGHVTQLAPLLAANADVIFVWQAGFIGAWGEWHNSTNGLDTDAARQEVVNALLAVLPPNRYMQLRNPVHKEALYGGALDPALAYSASAAARIGHHNDCFLASNTDFGTYPSGDVEGWKDYVAAETLFTPMGGETCAVFEARTDCDPAMAEMERLHYTYLNRDYNLDVLEDWEDQGCLPEIEKRLGYRITLVDGELPRAVRPGGSFTARVALRNDGYAAPVNSRSLWLVLDGPERLAVELPERDARLLAAGVTTTVEARLRLPAGIPPGRYRLALWLPDPLLPDRPAFAMRLATVGAWDGAAGFNVLGTVDVDESAEGSADPASASFSVL